MYPPLRECSTAFSSAATPSSNSPDTKWPGCSHNRTGRTARHSRRPRPVARWPTNRSRSLRRDRLPTGRAHRPVGKNLRPRRIGAGRCEKTRTRCVLEQMSARARSLEATQPPSPATSPHKGQSCPPHRPPRPTRPASAAPPRAPPSPSRTPRGTE
jgi:hypothetical protein